MSSVISLIQSLAERAARLEVEAQGLRKESESLFALFLGASPITPLVATPTPSRDEPSVAVQPRTQMPSVEAIRQKALQYGVDITDLMPQGKNPKGVEKQAAMKRIYAAKLAAEQQAREEPSTEE